MRDTVLTSGQRTVAAAVQTSAAILADTGIVSARLDARVLMAHVLGTGREALIANPTQPLSTAQDTAYGELVSRRAARVPVSRLLGWREVLELGVCCRYLRAGSAPG